MGDVVSSGGQSLTLSRWDCTFGLLPFLPVNGGGAPSGTGAAAPVPN